MIKIPEEQEAAASGYELGEAQENETGYWNNGVRNGWL